MKYQLILEVVESDPRSKRGRTVHLIGPIYDRGDRNSMDRAARELARMMEQRGFGIKDVLKRKEVPWPAPEENPA